MRDGVEAKFRQHEDLRALLLSTGDATLIEHTENDDLVAAQVVHSTGVIGEPDRELHRGSSVDDVGTSSES